MAPAAEIPPAPGAAPVEPPPATPVAPPAPEKMLPLREPTAVNTEKYQKHLEQYEKNSLRMLEHINTGLNRFMAGKDGKDVSEAVRQREEQDFIERQQRDMRAREVAAATARANKYIQKAQSGEQITQEEMKEVLKNFVNNGRDSALEKLYLNNLKFKNWQDALQTFGLEKEGFSLADEKTGNLFFEVNPDSKQKEGAVGFFQNLWKKLPRSLQTTTKELTKNGVMSAAAYGLSVLALGATAGPPALAAIVGGFALKSLVGVTGKLLRDRALFSKKEHTKSIGERAMADMVEYLVEQRTVAERALNNEELSPEQLTQEFNKVVMRTREAAVLRFNADREAVSSKTRHKRAGHGHHGGRRKAKHPAPPFKSALVNFRAYKKKWDIGIGLSTMLATPIGAGLGSVYGAAQAVAEAKIHGVKMVGSRVTENAVSTLTNHGGHYLSSGHEVMYSAHDHAWHPILNKNDVREVVGNNNNIMPSQGVLDKVWHFLSPSGQHNPMTSDTMAQIMQGQGTFLHAGLASDPSSQILEHAFSQGLNATEIATTLGVAEPLITGFGDYIERQTLRNRAQSNLRGLFRKAPKSSPESAAGGSDEPGTPSPEPVPPTPPTPEPVGSEPGPTPPRNQEEREQQRQEFKEKLSEPGRVLELRFGALGVNKDGKEKGPMLKEYVFTVGEPFAAEDGEELIMVKPLDYSGEYGTSSYPDGFGYSLDYLADKYFKGDLEIHKIKLDLNEPEEDENEAASIDGKRVDAEGYAQWNTKINNWTHSNRNQIGEFESDKPERIEIVEDLRRELGAGWPEAANERGYVMYMPIDSNLDQVRVNMQAIWQYQRNDSTELDGTVKVVYEVPEEIYNDPAAREAKKVEIKAKLNRPEVGFNEGERVTRTPENEAQFSNLWKNMQGEVILVPALETADIIGVTRAIAQQGGVERKKYIRFIKTAPNRFDQTGGYDDRNPWLNDKEYPLFRFDARIRYFYERYNRPEEATGKLTETLEELVQDKELSLEELFNGDGKRKTNREWESMVALFARLFNVPPSTSRPTREYLQEILPIVKAELPKIAEKEDTSEETKTKAARLNAMFQDIETYAKANDFWPNSAASFCYWMHIALRRTRPDAKATEALKSYPAPSAARPRPEPVITEPVPPVVSESEEAEKPAVAPDATEGDVEKSFLIGARGLGRDPEPPITVADPITRPPEPETPTIIEKPLDPVVVTPEPEAPVVIESSPVEPVVHEDIVETSAPPPAPPAPEPVITEPVPPAVPEPEAVEESPAPTPELVVPEEIDRPADEVVPDEASVVVPTPEVTTNPAIVEEREVTIGGFNNNYRGEDVFNNETIAANYEKRILDFSAIPETLMRDTLDYPDLRTFLFRGEKKLLGRDYSNEVITNRIEVMRAAAEKLSQKFLEEEKAEKATLFFNIALRLEKVLEGAKAATLAQQARHSGELHE